MPPINAQAVPTSPSAGAQQALADALQLLADVEARIRTVLHLDTEDSLLLADLQQLQQVPTSLLQSLESTVAVIDELRGQLSGTTAGCCIEGSSTGGCQQDEADKAQPNPAQSSGPTAPDVTDGRQGTHTAAGRAQRYTARAVHHKPAAAGPAGRPGSRHTGVPDSSTQSPQRVRSERIAAAQSSLFTPAATQCAVAQWRQHKVLQQEKAALSQQQQCLKEQQLLSQLAATEAAASGAHDQVLQRIHHTSDTTAVLQVLCSSKASFKKYLAAATAANPGQLKTVGEAGFQARPSEK